MCIAMLIFLFLYAFFFHCKKLSHLNHHLFLWVSWCWSLLTCLGDAVKLLNSSGQPATQWNIIYL